MEYTEHKLMLFFLILGLIALISNIMIDNFTPGGRIIDYTEFIDYFAIFSIILSIIILGFKKKH